ncbi:MAG: alpha/beta fold hydrolase, partial [Nitrososphaera sp.]
IVLGSQAEGWVTTCGMKTRYLEAGHGKAKHILFIHGLGSSADRWLDIPLALSLDHHTIAVDLPGFGMSEKPSCGMHYSIEEYADFIAQLMYDLKIDDGKVSLVGHSLGGFIAAETTITHRRLIDRLVLVDTSGMLNGPTPLLEQYLAASMNPTRESVRRVFEQLVANPIRIPDFLVDAFIYRIGLPGAKEAFRLAYENSVNTQIGKKRLGKIAGIKTLIIWGKEDRLIPLKYLSLFKKSINGSRVELVEDAGHAPFAEKPAVVFEIIRRFLS